MTSKEFTSFLHNLLTTAHRLMKKEDIAYALKKNTKRIKNTREELQSKLVPEVLRYCSSHASDDVNSNIMAGGMAYYKTLTTIMMMIQEGKYLNDKAIMGLYSIIVNNKQNHFRATPIGSYTGGTNHITDNSIRLCIKQIWERASYIKNSAMRAYFYRYAFQILQPFPTHNEDIAHLIMNYVLIQNTWRWTVDCQINEDDFTNDILLIDSKFELFTKKLMKTQLI